MRLHLYVRRRFICNGLKFAEIRQLSFKSPKFFKKFFRGGSFCLSIKIKMKSIVL